MTPRSNLVLALTVLCFAGLVLFLWIPLDVDTGLVEKQRRRTVIGDALAPTVAGVFLFIGALGVLIFERNKPDQESLSARNVWFLTQALIVIVASFVVMRYAGPLSVSLINLLTASEHDYRLLRDTTPWKHIGYFLGGVMLVSGLIGLVQGRLSWRVIGIGIGAVLALIGVYDLPFEDLLLPPNGDV